MMRIVLPLLVAFVIAAGGATGIVVLQAKGVAPVGPDTGAVAAHDSSAAPEASDAPAPSTAPAAPGDSALKASATHASAALSPSPAATATTAPAALAASAERAPAGVPAGAITGTATATTDKAPQPGARMISTPGIFVGGRISKIFTAMPVKQAAKILEQMADADVIVILGSVNDRKAAEILSLLPAQRAAGISKSVLANKVSDK